MLFRTESFSPDVVFAYESAGTFDTHLPIELIPCDISEGDRLYVRKTNETTEIRCTEFSPPTVDVIIIVTKWQEYRDIQHLSKSNHIIVDARRLLDVNKLSFKSYKSIGYSFD